MFLKDAKAVDDLGNEYPVDIQKTNGVERIQIQPEQICGAEYIDILLPAFNTEVGTHGIIWPPGSARAGAGYAVSIKPKIKNTPIKAPCVFSALRTPVAP